MDEQLRILKMIEEGTITAEQGAELMSAMNTHRNCRQRHPKAEAAMIRRCSVSW